MRAPFQGRWGDAAWDALSLLGGKLFGAAGKWLAASGLVARPVYQGVKLATPLGETTGFHSFCAFKNARGPAGPEDGVAPYRRTKPDQPGQVPGRVVA